MRGCARGELSAEVSQAALALLTVANPVQGQQVGDVPLLERDPAVFHAADLGMRAADDERGALSRDASILTQPAEVTAEHEALYRRTR